MTAVPFMLCVSWFASSPSLGTAVVPPGEAALYVAGGFNVTLPTLTLGATAGVSDGFDLDLRYDTHAGIVHDVAVTGRLRLSERFAAAVCIAYSFFAIEEVSGILAVRSPFSNGSTVAPDVRWTALDDGDTRVSLVGGFAVRWLTLAEDEFGTVTRDLELSVRHAFLEVGAEWTGDGASTWLRVRAVVPIEAEFRVLGYLPWIVIGRTWSVE